MRVRMFPLLVQPTARRGHCSAELFQLLGGIAVVAAGLAMPARGADWPYYRGPQHDGSTADPIRTTFPPEGPAQIWKVPVGNGFSSFSISGGLAFTQVRRLVAGQDSEVCVALNTATGAELWATRIDKASYPDGGAGADDGPRSTPCVSSSAVFVLSSYLKLTKLNGGDGIIVWQKDLAALYGGQQVSWQNAASPLLDNDLIFINCNSVTNSLLALRQADGNLVWRGGAERLTHASPVPATLFGTRQIIFFTQAGLVSVDAATGAELWRYGFPFNTSTAASPVVDGEMVYCSAAYSVGAGAVRISKAGSQYVATQIWRNANLMNQWTTAVALNGYVYGIFGTSYSSTAPLKCLELASGAERWSQPGFGPGGVLLVGGKLLITDAYGGVALAEADPNAYTELARFQAVSGKCWNSPAFSNGRLYARSTTEAACFDLSASIALPPLRQSMQWAGGDRLQLCISAADGNPVPADLLSSLQIRSTSNLLEPITLWAVVTNSPTLTNGTITLDLDARLTPQFFTLTNKP